MTKILLLLLLTSIYSNAQTQEPSILNELAAQKYFELIADISTPPTDSESPCPTLLEVELKENPNNYSIATFTYAKGSNTDSYKMNNEFFRVSTQGMNLRPDVERSYDHSYDVHIKKKIRVEGDATYFLSRFQIKYRDGLLSVFFGFGLPYRLFLNRVEEIKITKTDLGFKLAKSEIDYIGDDTTKKQVCFYKY